MTTPVSAPARLLYDDPMRLATEFLQQFYKSTQVQTLRFYRGEWWLYNGLCWRGADPAVLRAEVTDFIAQRHQQRAQTGDNSVAKPMSSKIVTTTLDMIQAKSVLGQEREMFSWLDDPSGRADRNYVAFANGILDIPAFLAGKPEAFQPPTAKWFSSSVLDYPFDPDAKCPRWVQFLDEVLGQDDQDAPLLIQEIFGYCIVPDTSFHKFFIMNGEGRNGKSTAIAVLEGLVGEKNVSHLSLESFGDPFLPSMTVGKLVNTMTEIVKLPPAVEGKFKAFVGGEPFPVQRKFVNPVDTYPTARCVFATNSLPAVRDHSAGFWERLVLIPFRRFISEENRDTTLAQTLRKELPGIALWALKGLERLRLQNKFTIPQASREALGQYKSESNPLGTWVSETYEFALDAEMPVKTVGELFDCTERMDDPTLPKPSLAQIKSEIQRAFPQCKFVRKMSQDLTEGRKKMDFVRHLRERQQ